MAMAIPQAAWNRIKSCQKYIILLSLLGVGISYYSIYVSTAKSKDPDYKALCDLSPSVRCSDVLTSKYSKGFGIVGNVLGENTPFYQSNGVYGMIAYSLFAVLSLYPTNFFAKVQLLIAFGSIFVSIYLGYILYYVLEELCIVCVSTYLINFLLWVLTLRNYWAFKELNQNESSNGFSTDLGRKQTKKSV